MAAHTEAVIETVRQSLIAGETFDQIFSRLGFSRASVTGIITRHGMTGLSQHRTIAKFKPVEAKPVLPNVILKFRKGPNVTPGNHIRELPVETSPRAVISAAYQPDHDCAWTVSPGMFCGRGKIPKSSYCLRHHRQAYPKKQRC